MRELATGFEKLILVCFNERTDGRDCCLGRGSPQVHARIKEWVRTHGLARRVRVSKSGCLDQCANGITVVVLPEFRWYGGVTLDDVDRIIARHLTALLPAGSADAKETS